MSGMRITFENVEYWSRLAKLLTVFAIFPRQLRKFSPKRREEKKKCNRIPIGFGIVQKHVGQEPAADDSKKKTKGLPSKGQALKSR